MTDYEYMMAQCRKYHFTQWDENVLRECQSIMPNLSWATCSSCRLWLHGKKSAN